MRTLNQELLKQIETFIIEYQKENGHTPNYREIKSQFSIKSLNTVRRYVLELEEQGRIERTSRGSIKGMPQLTNKGTVMIPLIGSIACGQPNFAVENFEDNYALPATLFGEGELYMLRTFGDSMVDIGIHEDDLIVVKKQNTARDGEIVVAMVNGETTLKRLFHHGKQIILHPENSEMEDIKVKTCDIQGVLVGCIKNRF